jgi:hypothetical protein
MTVQQKEWLTKLVNHPNQKYWLTPIEFEKVNKILERGTYNKVEQNLLQSIVKYYTENTNWKGTLDGVLKKSV